MKKSRSTNPLKPKCYSSIDLKIRQLNRHNVEYMIRMREFCNLSKEAAADLINIHRSTLIRYENETHSPAVSTFARIRCTYEDYAYSHHLRLTPDIIELIQKCAPAIEETEEGFFLCEPH